MLDQRTKERMIAEETSKFMDSNFGQLDLSGFPDLNHPPAEENFELQDRHGFNRVDESGLAGINQLKELLANPPREIVEEIARETQNPDLISELAHERAEDAAHEFRRRNPGYLKCDANWRSIVETCRSWDRYCWHTAIFSGTPECHRTNRALRLARSAAAAALCSVDYLVCQGPGTRSMSKKWASSDHRRSIQQDLSSARRTSRGINCVNCPDG
jgi:hypothetical protein